MVIYQSRCLHMGIHDCRAHESEAPFFHVLAKCVGLGRCRRYLPRRLSFALHWLAVDKIPDVVGKSAVLLLYFEKCPSIFPGPVNLEFVPNDTRILEKLVQALIAIPGNPRCIEVVEQGSISLPLSQYRNPGQSCLGSFEDQKLKLGLVVPNRDPPLFI